MGNLKTCWPELHNDVIKNGLPNICLMRALLQSIDPSAAKTQPFAKCKRPEEHLRLLKG